MNPPKPASVPEEKPRHKCQHENFTAKVDVSRITDSDGMLTGLFYADVRVKCMDCDKPLIFRGVEAGLSPQKPMASLDGQELRCPMQEKDSRIFPTIPGFTVRAQ